MTREEQIREAARRHDYDDVVFGEIFAEGARWADSHPVTCEDLSRFGSSEKPNNCKKFGMKGYENVVIHEGNAKGGYLSQPQPPVYSNSENTGKQ